MADANQAELDAGTYAEFLSNDRNYAETARVVGAGASTVRERVKRHLARAAQDDASEAAADGPGTAVVLFAGDEAAAAGAVARADAQARYDGYVTQYRAGEIDAAALAAAARQCFPASAAEIEAAGTLPGNADDQLAYAVACRAKDCHAQPGEQCVNWDRGGVAQPQPWAHPVRVSDARTEADAEAVDIPAAPEAEADEPVTGPEPAAEAEAEAEADVAGILRDYPELEAVMQENQPEMLTPADPDGGIDFGKWADAQLAAVMDSPSAKLTAGEHYDAIKTEWDKRQAAAQGGASRPSPKPPVVPITRNRPDADGAGKPAGGRRERAPRPPRPAAVGETRNPGGRQAERVLAKRCEKCGHQFTIPRARAICKSEQACQKRQAALAAA